MDMCIFVLCVCVCYVNVYAGVDTCTWHMQRMRRWSVDKEEEDDPSFEMIPKVMNYKPKCPIAKH